MKLLILIDFIEDSFFYKYIKTSNYIDYFNNKKKNILKTLQYCKDNNIDIMISNYISECKLNEIINENKIEYKYDLKHYPDFNLYDTILFCGSSLDQCLTMTRPLSYLNFKHKNKILIVDSSILLDDKHWYPLYKYNSLNIENIEQYTYIFLKQKKISYIESISEITN